MRRRTSPRSPAKRALTVLGDAGNTTPMPPRIVAPGEENALTLDDLAGPVESTTPQSPCGINTTPTETTFAPRSTLSRIEKRRSGTFGSFATVSPLKRSDGIMNLDQASRGSPSAKRRSVHTPNFSTDFSIFDNDNGDAPASPLANEGPFNPSPLPNLGQYATIPKRSSSLRRSTLQQRQSERPLFGRPKGAGETEPPPGTPLTVRPRMSFESSLFEPSPSNLFSSRPPPASPLFSATPSRSTAAPDPLASPLFSTTPSRPTPATPAPTASPFFAPPSHSTAAPPASPAPLALNTATTGQPPRASAHPLSRTITQSSSGSSLDDSPTHEPVHKPERARPVFNFSKSLPAGATRPAPVRRVTREESITTESFATPENFKSAKPLPTAFMSTGLISKKNRNAEEPAGFNKVMPDTPCKRPVNLFAQGPSSNFPHDRLFGESKLRQSQMAPASPFNPPPSTVRPKPGPFARGMGIFGSSFNRPEESRRGSFASIDGDESLQAASPSSRHDSQPLNDLDLPPTPTKQSFLPSRTYPPSTAQIASLEARSSANSTPLRDRLLQASPHTPRDQFFPPDPSGLSISVPNEMSQTDFDNAPLPATPTGPRESFISSKRPSFSLSGYSNPDVDPSLTARFAKVELIGTGEFSQVYRVAAPHDATLPSVFSLPSSGPESSSVIPHQAWAVKKSKRPYLGWKDRECHLREVEVLKSLTHSDHVISYMDSWEDNGHLYIQTEFCEEGSLDAFLAQAGVRARLDDFRIWKILLELSLGLKHIHDQGFIHLDLKPANILVTFEGVLKIGDFGMATRWPAQSGIEGEGDREYIGPEILMGRFDKPADIFSLGLIMFEIAGNVELPDNGVSWQKLRNGDMSDVPSLTWSSETSIFRDATGNPLSEESSFEELCTSDLGGLQDNIFASRQQRPSRLARSGELVNPPAFMVDAHHPDTLDKTVRWMISPDPLDRPTADQILDTYGVLFVARRRRAGATVFEGNWGPADEILAEDAEMIDV